MTAAEIASTLKKFADENHPNWKRIYVLIREEQTVTEQVIEPTSGPTSPTSTS